MGGTDGAGPLQGPTFKGNWNGVPLGAMVDRIRQTMPLDKPASLSRQQTADVLTFILSVNKAPTGKAELSRQAEILNTITFTAAAKWVRPRRADGGPSRRLPRDERPVSGRRQSGAGIPAPAAADCRVFGDRLVI